MPVTSHISVANEWRGGLTGPTPGGLPRSVGRQDRMTAMSVALVGRLLCYYCVLSKGAAVRRSLSGAHFVRRRATSECLSRRPHTHTHAPADQSNSFN